MSATRAPVVSATDVSHADREGGRLPHEWLGVPILALLAVVTAVATPTHRPAGRTGRAPHRRRAAATTGPAATATPTVLPQPTPARASSTVNPRRRPVAPASVHEKHATRRKSMGKED